MIWRSLSEMLAALWLMLSFSAALVMLPVEDTASKT